MPDEQTEVMDEALDVQEEDIDSQVADETLPGVTDEQKKAAEVFDVQDPEDEDDQAEPPADDDSEEEEETVAAEAAEAEPTEEESEDWLDKRLSDAGRDLGMSEIEMRRFGSAKNLEQAIVEEVNLRFDEQNAPKDAEVKEEEFDLGLSPEDFDPAVIKAFEKVHSHHDAQRKTLERAVVGLANMVEKSLGQVMDSQFDRWMDGRIASLGDQYEEIFGTGGVDDIDQSSKQYANRVALRAELKSRIDRGSDGSRKQSFERAVRALHGDKIAKLERKKLSSEVRSRSRQAVSRTTRRKSSPATSPTELAIQHVGEKMAALGMGRD